MLRVSGGGGSGGFGPPRALKELGAWLGVSARPEGTLKVDGSAALDRANEYKVMANLGARGIGIQAGATRISGVSFDSAVQAGSHRIELSGLRLAALGGNFTGSAALQEFAQFHLAGNLRNLDIAQLATVFTPGGLGYVGLVSGPLQADGDIRDFGTLAARADLAIAPAPRGIPVSGHLAASYNARAASVHLDNSRLALPHTAADFSGSLGKQIQVRLVSRNLADFQPIAAVPVTFSAGGAPPNQSPPTGSLGPPPTATQMAVTHTSLKCPALTPPPRPPRAYPPS